MTRVINLIGGPGAGKSTTAAGVFYALKQRRISCEYVTEFAKDVTWEGTHALLENQLAIFSEQYRRQWRLVGKVDYIVTDAPLLLSCVYHIYGAHRHHKPAYVEACRRFFLETYRQFDNTLYLVTHGIRPYSTAGRSQTKEAAEEVHRSIITFIDAEGIPYKEIPPENAGVRVILADMELL